MKQSYNSLVSTIKSQRNPEGLNEGVDFRILNKALSDTRGIGSLSYDDVDEFIHQAMKSVGDQYTYKTLQAGSMVKQYLQEGLSDVTYRYQGSVMTNTHIKGYSDIDLVCICDKFYSYATRQINEYLSDTTLLSRLNETSVRKLQDQLAGSQYTGNYLEDLRFIRSSSEDILTGKYDICKIDHPKAIKLTNKNLRRDVDVVTACWYDDVSSVINDKGNYRGIELYNKATNSTESPDYPFISIDRINERGKLTAQRLKKMIRFLKTVRSSSDLEIDLSSFAINAICYNISVNKYSSAGEKELVEVLMLELFKICNSREYADTIVSVDGREWIYKNNTQRWNETHKLYKEVVQINVDLKQAATI